MCSKNDIVYTYYNKPTVGPKQLHFLILQRTRQNVHNLLGPYNKFARGVCLREYVSACSHDCVTKNVCTHTCVSTCVRMYLCVCVRARAHLFYCV